MLDSDDLVISVQVLQEFYVNMVGKYGVAPTVASQTIEGLAAWPVFETDVPAVLQATQLSQDAVLSFWDLLIAVAASRSGADIFYTEDLNHGQTLLGVRIVDPFLDG